MEEERMDLLLQLNRDVFGSIWNKIVDQYGSLSCYDRSLLDELEIIWTIIWYYIKERNMDAQKELPTGWATPIILLVMVASQAETNRYL